MHIHAIFYILKLLRIGLQTLNGYFLVVCGVLCVQNVNLPDRKISLWECLYDLRGGFFGVSVALPPLENGCSWVYDKTYSLV